MPCAKVSGVRFGPAICTPMAEQLQLGVDEVDADRGFVLRPNRLVRLVADTAALRAGLGPEKLAPSDRRHWSAANSWPDDVLVGECDAGVDPLREVALLGRPWR